MLTLPQSSTVISRPIIHSWHCWYCFDISSNILGGALLCQPLLCSRKIWICGIHHFCYFEWETVEFFLTNMPDIVLPNIYFHCTHCPTSLLPPLYSVAPIIIYLFSFPRCLASIPHLWWCFLDCSAYLPLYPLPYLSAFPFVLCVWLFCPCQLLYFLLLPSSVIFIALYICLHHTHCPTSLTHILWYCLHCHSSIILLSPFSRIFPPIICYLHHVRQCYHPSIHIISTIHYTNASAVIPPPTCWEVMMSAISIILYIYLCCHNLPVSLMH